MSNRVPMREDADSPLIGSIDLWRCDLVRSKHPTNNPQPVCLFRAMNGRYFVVDWRFEHDTSGYFISQGEAAGWFLDDPQSAPEDLAALASKYDLTEAPACQTDRVFSLTLDDLHGLLLTIDPCKVIAYQEADRRCKDLFVRRDSAPPPATNGRTPSGDGMAATNGIDHDALAKQPAATNDHAPEALIPLTGYSAIVRPTGCRYVLSQDELSVVLVSFDGCRVFPLRDASLDRGGFYLTVYATRDGRWIQHTDCVSSDKEAPSGMNDLLAEISPNEAARLIAKWLDDSLPPDLEPYRESAPQPATNGRAPEAPSRRPELVNAPRTSGNGQAAPTNGHVPEAPAELTPPARALAAAYDLQREGKPISLKAACARSRVDRKNLRKRYPETADAIRRMASLNCAPRRGVVDRRTGNPDALDDPED